MRRMLFAIAVALGFGATVPISNAAVTVETVSGQEFVQFGLSFSRAENPAFDKNGDDCYAGQHGDTWYFAAKFGGTAVRSCEVPEGVALVVTTAMFSASRRMVRASGRIAAFMSSELGPGGSSTR